MDKDKKCKTLFGIEGIFDKMIDKEKIKFKIGDWVILKEEFVARNFSSEFFQKSFIERYYKPRKITNITYQKGKNEKLIIQIFIQVKEKEIACKWKNFRKATESEIRKEKMKSIFIKK